LGAAAYFGLHARSLSDDLSRPHAVYDPDTIAAGHAADRNFLIASAAGAALVVGGAALYVVGRRREVVLMPVVTPAGVALTGSVRCSAPSRAGARSRSPPASSPRSMPRAAAPPASARAAWCAAPAPVSPPRTSTPRRSWSTPRRWWSTPRSTRRPRCAA